MLNKKFVIQRQWTRTLSGVHSAMCMEVYFICSLQPVYITNSEFMIQYSLFLGEPTVETVVHRELADLT